MPTAPEAPGPAGELRQRMPHGASPAEVEGKEPTNAVPAPAGEGPEPESKRKNKTFGRTPDGTGKLISQPIIFGFYRY